MIGKHRLSALAGAADEHARGAARAACAELEAAHWTCADDARASFPFATLSERRIAIELDERHCLVAELNYEIGVALIISAGRPPKRAATPRTASRTPR